MRQLDDRNVLWNGWQHRAARCRDAFDPSKSDCTGRHDREPDGEPRADSCILAIDRVVCRALVFARRDRRRGGW